MTTAIMIPHLQLRTLDLYENGRLDSQPWKGKGHGALAGTAELWVVNGYCGRDSLLSAAYHQTAYQAPKDSTAWLNPLCYKAQQSKAVEHGKEFAARRKGETW